MDKLSGSGFFVAAILWLLIMFFSSGETACLNSFCGRGDLMLASIVGVGYLVPAYLGARFLGLIFNSLLETSRTDSSER